MSIIRIVTIFALFSVVTTFASLNSLYMKSKDHQHTEFSSVPVLQVDAFLIVSLVIFFYQVGNGYSHSFSDLFFPPLQGAFKQ